MDNNPTYYSETMFLGDLEITFRGEKYDNKPILDTSVKIGEQTVCWITWNDKKSFVQELNDIISKYRI